LNKKNTSRIKHNIDLEEGKTSTIYKYVAIVTSRYHENDELKEAASKVLA
jgi:trehalose/maltose hydrolase-like predicted phosphorylase